MVKKGSGNEKLKRVFVSIGILIVLVVVFYFSAKAITNYTGRVVADMNSNSIEGFAKCLTEHGVKMYGAYWCGHCQNQKRMFGDAVQYVDYIECDVGGENSHADLCSQKEIGGYPTWEIKGEFYPGEMNLAKLAELSGCSIE